VTDWFATRKLEPGVFLVSEPVHVNSFLIEGSSAAALIDTGLGIGNIREVAEDLASHDVFALNTINTGPIYAQLADSDVKAFARSTRRLAELASSVRVVYVPHFVRYAVDPLFLVEVADGFEQVAAGEVALRPNEDYVGSPVQEAIFQRFSIFIAAPGEAPVR